MKSPQERKLENEKRIQEINIAINQALPMIESAEEITLKSIDEICCRAAASLLTIQLAFDAVNGEYDKGHEVISKIMDIYSVKDCLNKLEKRVYDGTFDQDDLLNVTWEYECCWSLMWALGLIDDSELTNAGEPCDCNKAINLLGSCKDLEEFKSKCKLRDVDDILDMLDLFFRYHWACVHKRIAPETPIGDLDEEVVMERRRGLEWLVSLEKDWGDIALHT